MPTVAVVDGVPLMVGGTAAAVIVRLALADFVASSLETTVTVTVAGDGTVAGAVNRPAPETVPTVAFPPVVPLTFQLTAPVAPLVTVEVNCCLPEPAVTLANVGEMVIDTGAVIVIDADPK